MKTYFTLEPQWRFALSDESGTDSGFNECVLLNHIPHSANRNAAGAYYYRFTVDIPDVKCDGCTLQVINVMTDKIGAGNSCNFDPLFKNAAAGECFSNYYSCADVKITGTIPRSSLQCAQPNNWPYLLETARTGTTAQPLVYHNAEVAEWTDGWLKTLPASFQQPAGLGATILKADVPTPGSNTGDVVVTSAPSTGGSTSTADTTSAPASSGSTTTYAAVAVVGMGAVAAYLLTTRKKPTPNGVMPNQQQMQAMQGSNYAYGP